jgi:hypothetical protein
LSDSDWFLIEVLNAGPTSRIASASVDARDVDQSRSLRNLLSLRLGGSEDPETRGWPAGIRRNLLVAGRLVTGAAGDELAAYLRAPAQEQSVRLRLSISLQLADGRSFAPEAPVIVSFRWRRPTAGEVDALRLEALRLFEDAIAVDPEYFSPQVLRLRALLATPAVSAGIPRSMVLDAVRQRPTGKSLHLFNTWGLIDDKYQVRDPVVVAFYAEALRESGRAAATLGELASVSVGPWDESFIEPIVAIVEASSDIRALELSQGLHLLDRHHTAWSADPTIAGRLSRTVLRLQAEPTRATMYRWARMLAQTHDRSVIEVLRPLLADSRTDEFTSLSSNMPAFATPMRFSELAANSICRLLGHREMFSTWQRARLPTDGSIREWEAWDRRLGLLRTWLDAGPERAPRPEGVCDGG